MPQKNNFSKIKNIYIPLFEYEFDHGPSSKDKPNDKFQGRTKIKKRIQLLFNKSSSKHGAYLVTGYRGVGKTSVVREAFNEKVNNSKKAFKDENELEIFNFSLSQDEVKDVDLLRQISWQLIQYSRKNIFSKSSNKVLFLLSFLIKIFLFLLTFSILLDLFLQNVELKWFSIDFKDYINSLSNAIPLLFKTTPLSPSISVGVPLLFFGFFAIIFSTFNMIVNLILKLLFDIKGYKRDLENTISLFEKRLYSSVIQEDRQNNNINLGQTNPFTSIANRILNSLSSSVVDTKKNTLNFGIATTKELEHNLTLILNIISKIRTFRNNKFYVFKNIPEFIFVVDELDKIEPDYYFARGDRESDEFIHHNEMPFHIHTKARKRQEAISKLLANLKNFLTDVNAKFIFIGGRDIYDAALADISDRESFYSSIFNEVIYVDTFFKDKKGSNAGLSQLAEKYVFEFLFPPLENKNEEDTRTKNLINYVKLLEISNSEENFKIIHLLQNFFIFLIYRSNGSPKKLIELMERYIVDIHQYKSKRIFSEVQYKINSNKIPYGTDQKYYLRFSYKDQYEINLTSNLYRPYTIINSKHLKTLGDKLLYSSAFLMDHILKFHRTAFSWRNLEMIPDIILANKEPNFRQFFQEIMNFLSNQHIRQTLNAIFQYKFHDRVKNELEYLSKTSELSSAAFNFTLDESFHLKSYYKKKLGAKYLEYKQADNEKGEFIHSIGYLHSLIGDLHYYDEEYDDAIVHYTDAIQPMRQILRNKKRLMNHQFVLYVRNKLALGLSLEKIRSYDKAYSIYRNIILHSSSFNPKDENSKWEKPFKRIQLFLRPNIALLGIIEKQRNDGITYDNLERNILEYSKFLQMGDMHLFPSKENFLIDYQTIGTSFANVDNSDKKRLVTLFVDYYLSVGNMLFYKNQVFYRLLFDVNRIENESISLQIRSNILKNRTKEYFPSHASYLYYLHALSNFNTPYIENHNYFNPTLSLKENRNRELNILNELQFLEFYNSVDNYSILNSKQNETIANILGKLGDTILASIIDTNETNGEVFIKIFNENVNNTFKALSRGLDSNISLKTVAILYKLSNHFYYKSGNMYEASFQLRKGLYVLRDGIKHFMGFPTYKSIEKLSETILNDQSEISKGSNRAQISKYRANTNDDPLYTEPIYKGVSTEPIVKEVLYLTENIKKKINPNNYEIPIKIGSYNTISSMFTRIIELKLQAKIDLWEIKSKCDQLSITEAIKYFKEIKNTNKTVPPGIEQLKENIDYIANGLFCNSQLLRILNTYGISYILNYSFLAFVHRSMGIFSVYYHLIKKYYPNDEYKRLDNILSDLIGENTQIDFDPFYHYDLCYQNLKHAKSLHSEGKLFKEIFRGMFVLDDDLNDNLTHFCAALERYRINTGGVDSIMKEVQVFLEDTKLKNYQSYI